MTRAVIPDTGSSMPAVFGRVSSVAVLRAHRALHMMEPATPAVASSREDDWAAALDTRREYRCGKGLGLGSIAAECSKWRPPAKSDTSRSMATMAIRPSWGLRGMLSAQMPPTSCLPATSCVAVPRRFSGLITGITTASFRLNTRVSVFVGGERPLRCGSIQTVGSARIMVYRLPERASVVIWRDQVLIDEFQTISLLAVGDEITRHGRHRVAPDCDSGKAHDLCDQEVTEDDLGTHTYLQRGYGLSCARFSWAARMSERVPCIAWKACNLAT